LRFTYVADLPILAAEGWKAELALLADSQRTLSTKWSPVNQRSGIGQRKSASQRPDILTTEICLALP